MKTKVVPIVLGALGTVPMRLKGNLKDTGVDTSITLIQKSALLGSEFWPAKIFNSGFWPSLTLTQLGRRTFHDPN